VRRAGALAGLAVLLLAAHAPEPKRHHPAKSADDDGPAKARPHKAKAAAGPADDDDDQSEAAIEAVHTVKPGETLGGIAHRAKVPRVLIIEANHLRKPYAVHDGQKLKLPRTRHHTVKTGETGFDLALKYGVPYKTIAIANGLDPKAPLKPGQKLLVPTVLASAAPPASKGDEATAPEPKARRVPAHPDFAWPLEGDVRRGFTPRGRRGAHDGIDIKSDEGMAVRAVAAGKVLFAGREPHSFGNLVVIGHSGNWQSAYGFLGAVTVARGDKIHAHERIGKVGHSGKAKGDELHFELRQDNQPVDPMDILPKR
jgi:murein DD-endopeptidase MepM/ murein hydrolase activator NlpD